VKERQHRSERGAVSVEIALGLPIVIMVLITGIHFGLVLKTRHELADATSHATRLAAIARAADPNVIRSTIQARLGPSSGCQSLLVAASSAVDAYGVRRVDVTARCTVNTGIAGPLLAVLGSSELAVRASMPY
jgi:Flp pilus assembly protein TadG